MTYFTAKELAQSQKSVFDAVRAAGRATVTVNGKPSILMIDVSSKDVEETIAALRQVQAMQAVNKMRIAAERSGVSPMSMEEIDAEIAAVRKERAATN